MHDTPFIRLARAALAALLLAGLAACAADDGCIDTGGGYVSCPDSGVLHTEAERATMPVQDMTLIDLYWETKAASDRKREVDEELRRALQWKTQRLARASPAEKQAEADRLQARFRARINAAYQRSDALSAELHRRCPGGASLNPTSQSCSMRREP